MRLMGRAWTFDPVPLVEDAAKELEGVMDPWRRLRRDHPHLEIALVVVAYIEFSSRSGVPDLSLEPELIGRLAKLDLDLIQDYQLLLPDESKLPGRAWII
jgi:hypothetical protein